MSARVCAGAGVGQEDEGSFERDIENGVWDEDLLLDDAEMTF